MANPSNPNPIPPPAGTPGVAIPNPSTPPNPIPPPAGTSGVATSNTQPQQDQQTASVNQGVVHTTQTTQIGTEEKEFDNHKLPVTLSYPKQAGGMNIPAWIKFGVYDRQVTARGALLTTIGLYMPEKASMPSTVSWENEKIGYKAAGLVSATQKAVSAYNSETGQNFVQALMNDPINTANNTIVRATEMARGMNGGGAGGGNAAKTIKRMAASGAAHMAMNQLGTAFSAFAQNQDGGSFSTDQVLGMVSGSIRNPYLTAMFRGVDFRTFEFSFTFFPHNEQECIEIYNIIKTFRMASLPKYAVGRSILDYPLEFDIAYMWGQNENQFIHKFKPSVLTSIDTNYTGNGSWTSMKNSMPASIILNLRFSEIEIVTRDDVMGGY